MALPEPSSDGATSYHQHSHTWTGLLFLAWIPAVTTTGLLASALSSPVHSQHHSHRDSLKAQVSSLLQALQSFLSSLKANVKGQESSLRSVPWLPTVLSTYHPFSCCSVHATQSIHCFWNILGFFALAVPSAWYGLPQMSAGLTYLPTSNFAQILFSQ